MRTSFVGLVSVVILGVTGSASAEGLPLLEATVGLGVGDRSSTGVGEPLLGLGYDQSFGPLVNLDVRLFMPEENHIVRMGPVLRVAHTAGPSMGTFTGHAMRATAIDLGFAGRVRFPCMSHDDFSVHLGGYIGITGLVADADRGDTSRAGTENATLVASRVLDHAGLGGTLGLNLDVHFSQFVMGIGFDLHQWFGIDSVVARDLMLSSVLRFGGEFELGSHASQNYYYGDGDIDLL